MAVQRPDSGYSWVIVICCAYLHFALFGLFRSGGVMYVAILHNYNVSREEASWPFALCAAVFQLVGPAVSIVTHYISQRKAFLIGSGVATVGLAACYFADSVVWITVFYGVIHGLGLGIVVTLVPVTLNQYFVKHRATAIGMAFSGGALSSLVFPTAMEWMLEQYSLRESFLLLSGFALNTIVASCFLKPPPWMKKTEDTKLKLVEKSSEVSSEYTNHKTRKSSLPAHHNRTMVQNLESSQSLLEEANSTKQQTDLCEITNRVVESQQEVPSQCVNTSNDNINTDTTNGNNGNVLFDTSDTIAEAYESVATSENDRESDTKVKELTINNDQIIVMPKQNIKKLDVASTPRSRAFQSISSILKQPIFHLITFTMCVYFLGITSFLMVIVDFAKDKGIPESKGIYIIAIFSITDFFGRVCLGWITDRNYITRKNMMALNLGILGILYQIYPLINSLTALLVASAVNGLSIGCSITLFFVLQADCLGLKRLTLVIGLASFMVGALSLLQPGMVGLFRDVIGSYNWMFHFLGIISILFSIIWIAESWRTKERNCSYNVEDEKCDIKYGN